jgi:co-chaperonin GroES (HSP10)
MAISTEDVLRGEPINGHILIKVDLAQIKEDAGISRDSKLILTDMQEKAFANASSRGEVVKMATDAFGMKYKDKYGEEINPPAIGDIVHFVPYQSNRMDKDGEYYLITDDGVKFIERKAK